VKIYTKVHIFLTSQNIRSIAPYINELWGGALNVIIEKWWGRRLNIPPRYIAVFSYNLHFWKIALYIRNFLKFLLYPCNNVMYHQGYMYPRLGTTDLRYSSSTFLLIICSKNFCFNNIYTSLVHSNNFLNFNFIFIRKVSIHSRP